MILLYALLFILFEALTEALIKKHYPKLSEVIFKWWVQWIIAIVLFAVWFMIAYNFDRYYVPTWKLILGFVFVRFLIFDITWNLARGVKWNYYGTTKLYDRIMTRLGSWGWFMKLVCGVVGVCFLMGWS
jgi:hypothetical protein